MFGPQKVGTLIILNNNKKVRFCDDCEEEKDKFLLDKAAIISSQEEILDSDHDNMFGKICKNCHAGIGNYWYECKYCHCLENEEYSHMCDEMRAVYEDDPDLMSFDEWQISSWKNNPIPD